MRRISVKIFEVTGAGGIPRSIFQGITKEISGEILERIPGVISAVIL